MAHDLYTRRAQARRHEFRAFYKFFACNCDLPGSGSRNVYHQQVAFCHCLQRHTADLFDYDVYHEQIEETRGCEEKGYSAL